MAAESKWIIVPGIFPPQVGATSLSSILFLWEGFKTHSSYEQLVFLGILAEGSQLSPLTHRFIYCFFYFLLYFYFLLLCFGAFIVSKYNKSPPRHPETQASLTRVSGAGDSLLPKVMSIACNLNSELDTSASLERELSCRQSC